MYSWWEEFVKCQVVCSLYTNTKKSYSLLILEIWLVQIKVKYTLYIYIYEKQENQ